MQQNEQLAYLNSLGLHNIKPGLQRITNVLELLGNPQNTFKSIIIGGTNGKGSVSAAVASVLIQSDIKTGLYTSPHLIKVNERISINNSTISDSDLEGLIKYLRIILEKHNIRLSYFEFITTLSFIYFSVFKIDIAVLEVGMGGRWDATNVVTPLVSVITNISFDHMEYLGSTLSEIAQEKAEIIKNNIPVVTACSNKSIEPIIRKAYSCSAPLYIYGTEFNTDGSSTDNFSYKSRSSFLDNLSSNLSGKFQVENICVALKTLDILINKYKYNISEASIRKGLQKINWPGRFEILDEKRPVILDCAHNEESSNVLIHSLKQLYPDTSFDFLIGMLDDKQHTIFIKNIAAISNTIIITNGFSQKEADTGELSEICKELNCNLETIDNYKTAFNRLINDTSPLCITGSIYLVGAIKKLLIETDSNFHKI